MLGAVVADARPVELAGDELVAGLRRGRRVPEEEGRGAAQPHARWRRLSALVTGHALQLSYELREDARESHGAAALSEEELVARLKDEFDAEEISDDEEEAG